MSDACDKIPHHVHPVSSVVFFGIPTSSLDMPQKSCDNGEKAIEDTLDDPKLTTHRPGFRRACVSMGNSPWTRRRDSPREERRNHG
jgi:hypothetical protein